MLRLFTLLGSTVFLCGCASAVLDTTRLEVAKVSGVCHVHDVRMTQERVRIIYGLVAVPMGAAYKAQITKFPFARRDIYGGCVFMDGPTPELSSPEFAEIFICTRCDVSKADWIRWHPWDPWAKTWKANVPNKAPEPTTGAVTPRAPSSTSRASPGRGSS
jgi:hypothetical protein